ncbi:cysteine desulfurase-like protein [Branchiibius sp. NY16-3462-2]|uniref:cysteine desulfurase-like protein n=1 Tax=Branchiibius sp. NY16-3462-2 TaxID=1807500 RepID=UPI0007942541|nr:cysteine desulfurase-like protein [Branchiibius sp. NY16-3462-2]KYH44511.1 cysteine desulfurase [Branchiibius sp. NY16-3462-2]
MTFDVAAFRSQFPALAAGEAYFDGAGGTQTPASVADAIAGALRAPLSNRGAGSLAARNAARCVEEFRSAYGDLGGVPTAGIVHGRSATALTFDFSRTLARTWGSGDEIVLSQLDHDCNVRPWAIAAERAGVVVRWLELDPATGQFTAESLESAITPCTRLVAVTGASNLIGSRPDVAAIAAAAHDADALVWVDGVHHAAHSFIDVAALGADFYVCSPYKFFGPHCGVLLANPAVLEELSPDKLLPSTDESPERFELGTLPYEQLAGATAAVDFIASWGAGQSRRERLRSAHEAFAAHESQLLGVLDEGLTDLVADGRVVNHSRAQRRTPTTLLTFAEANPAAIADALAAQALIAPAGSFYAYEPARALGLGESGGLRISLAPYTSVDEVERLVAGVRAEL